MLAESGRAAMELASVVTENGTRRKEEVVCGSKD